MTIGNWGPRRQLSYHEKRPAASTAQRNSDAFASRSFLEQRLSLFSSRLNQCHSGYSGCVGSAGLSGDTAMGTSSALPVAPEADLGYQTQLSSLYGVFVFSSLMFDGRPADAVLDLAAEAVQSLGKCCTDRVYRVVDGSLIDSRDPHRPLDTDLDAAVCESMGVDQEIALPDLQWRYAITLRTLTSITGVLVVRASAAASCQELLLLKVIAQQTAAAMASADLIERERGQRLRLKELTDERAGTIHRLSQSVAELERRELIHKALTAASGSGTGEAGIADTLYELTSLTVSVEDVFGNLRAWSPGPSPATYQPVGGGNREDLLRRAAANGQHTRYGHWTFSLIRPKTDALGVIVLHDPDRRADRLDIFALQYAAAVLAIELSHQRSLAETELRLSRDLVDDLLAGTDDASAYCRAEALGHNLRIPHRVTVLEWNAQIDSDLVARSASRWAAAAGLHPLCARHRSTTILITEDLPDPLSLHRAISVAVGSSRGWIGIGSVATSPSELPRSFSEAQRALRIQKASLGQYGVRCFDDLGVCRILDLSHGAPEVRAFLAEWLGRLTAYDREKNTELVNTLARYLDFGGNYDQTADALNIHRSTLRYRLGRIREISGRDLQDVDTRLNLHLATRVFEMTATTDTIHVGH